MRPKTEGSVRKKCTHFFKEVGSRRASAEVWEGGGSGMVKHRAVKGKRTKGEGTVRHCQRCGGKKQGARFQRGRDLQDK